MTRLDIGGLFILLHVFQIRKLKRLAKPFKSKELHLFAFIHHDNQLRTREEPEDCLDGMRLKMTSAEHFET